jgi:mRNA interferase RelE/StbE
VSNQYAVIITEDALNDIEAITDTAIRKSVQGKISQLKENPQAQGKPLVAELQGYYRIKVRRRYRMVYRVAVLDRQVVVVIVGIRKQSAKRDIYKIARRRLK